MPWFAVNDKFHSHVKAIKAGVAGVGAWTLAGSWCSDHLTDGRIPVEVAHARFGGSKVWAKLVGAELVDRDGDTYTLRGFLDCNPSAESVLADRTAKSEAKQRAGRAGGVRSGEARRTKRDEAETKQTGSRDEADGKQNEAPIPDPTPTHPPDPNHTHTAGARADTPAPDPARDPAAPTDPALDPARLAIASRFIPADDTAGWEIWRVLVRSGALRLAEQLDGTAEPGSLARQASGISGKLATSGLPASVGLSVAADVARDYDAARTAQGTHFVAPTMETVAKTAGRFFATALRHHKGATGNGAPHKDGARATGSRRAAPPVQRGGITHAEIDAIEREKSRALAIEMGMVECADGEWRMPGSPGAPPLPAPHPEQP